jgi:tight adherence protein B
MSLGFIIIAVVIWVIALSAWLVVSKYFQSSDTSRIKERLIGSAVKTVRRKKAVAASVIQAGTRPGQNKFADLLIEKYQLGPRIALLLEQAGLQGWTPARLIHVCLMAFLAAAAVVWMLPVPSLFAVAAGAAASILPLAWVWWRKGRRLYQFEAVFPETLEFISRSMRAGHAFSVSLELIHREFPEPVSGEFRRTFEEHNLGLPLDTALQKLAVRVPSLDVHFFVSAVLLQKRTGGNLAEILDKLAVIIRERFKLRGRIRAVSAHGRMTAGTLSAIPIGVGLLMFMTNPDYVTFFFEDEIGNIMLGGAVALQLIGFAIMKKIVNIEV